jgi:hypothetical protein
MDIAKERLAVARKLSLTGATALIATSVLSVYLLQRACTTSTTDPTEAFQSMDHQATMYKLNFAFSTMSIAWPVVLGLLMVMVAYAFDRREKLWADAPDGEPSLRGLDYADVDITSFAYARSSVGLMRVLPRVALVAHALAPLLGIGVALLVVEPDQRAFGQGTAVLDGVLYLLRIAAVGYGLACSGAFTRSIKKAARRVERSAGAAGAATPVIVHAHDDEQVPSHGGGE